MNPKEDSAYFEWWNAYGEMADIDVEYPAYRAGKAYQQKQNSAELAALRSQLATVTAELDKAESKNRFLSGVISGMENAENEKLEQVTAEREAMREALEPFVMAYNENGGCVPITEDDREEMLYSIFNVISLEDFSRAAALKGGKG